MCGFLQIKKQNLKDSYFEHYDWKTRVFRKTTILFWRPSRFV